MQGTIRAQASVAGQDWTFETGRLAGQADGGRFAARRADAAARDRMPCSDLPTRSAVCRRNEPFLTRSSSRS